MNTGRVVNGEGKFADAETLLARSLVHPLFSFLPSALQLCLGFLFFLRQTFVDDRVTCERAAPLHPGLQLASVASRLCVYIYLCVSSRAVAGFLPPPDPPLSRKSEPRFLSSAPPGSRKPERLVERRRCHRYCRPRPTHPPRHRPTCLFALATAARRARACVLPHVLFSPYAKGRCALVVGWGPVVYSGGRGLPGPVPLAT